LSDWKNPDWLDTLSAAYAEAGQFEEAVKTQSLAIELASEAQRLDLESRLALYREQKPYRDEPAK